MKQEVSKLVKSIGAQLVLLGELLDKQELVNETNSFPKFNSREGVEQIRRLYKTNDGNGKFTMMRLAEMFNTTDATIFNIVHRKGRYENV